MSVGSERKQKRTYFILSLHQLWISIKIRNLAIQDPN